MKWLVIALSVVTVTIWGIVLFFYMNLEQTNYVNAEQHKVVKYKQDYKQTNFTFRANLDTKVSTQENSNKDNSKSEQSQGNKLSLASIIPATGEDNIVSIDEVMSVLDIEFE